VPRSLPIGCPSNGAHSSLRRRRCGGGRVDLVVAGRDDGRVGRPILCVVGAMVASLLSVSACGGSVAQRLAGSPASGGARPASCARREPRSVPANTWALTRSELAPPGATAIRLCRYGVLPSLLLQRSTLLRSSSVVSRIVRDFDRLPPPPSGLIACPADLGSQVVALIAYPAERLVTISADLTGCAGVTNGNLSRSAAGVGTPRPYGPQLLAELGRLTGYRGTVY